MTTITAANRTLLFLSLRIQKTESKKSSQKCRTLIVQRQGRHRFFTNVSKQLTSILPAHQLIWNPLHQCRHFTPNKQTTAHSHCQCKETSPTVTNKKLLSLHSLSSEMPGMTKEAHRTVSFSAFLERSLSLNSSGMIPGKCHQVSSLWLCLWIADLHSLFLQRTRKDFSLRSTNARCRCQCVVVRPANRLDSTLLGKARYRHNNVLLPLVRPWLNRCGLILASVLLRLRL
jgi:hypothetical protein